jgi:large subunit ribosomal protein L17
VENRSESNSEIEQKETGKYLGLNFIRAPKRNHDAMTQIGLPFVEWFKNHGVRPEIYYLGGTKTIEQNESTPEGLESITNKLSIGEDEELWVLLQFYRNQAHANEVYTKMMLDESIGQLVKQFDDLITRGSSLIMGGFSHVEM